MACSSLIAAAIDCFDDGSAIIVCPFECPNGSRRDMQGQRLDHAATRTLDMIDCVEMAAAPDGALRRSVTGQRCCAAKKSSSLPRPIRAVLS